ncbi:MAG: ribosome silencing factor [Eubacteriaceae bacterium]|jgi:ribosome-associated protein
MEAKQQSAELAAHIRDWIEEKNGKDIKVLDISEVSSLGDYFIIASGTSDRQVTAIADNIQDKATEMGIEPKNVEGLRTGHWILLDYYDVIVHIFQEQDREFYNLERLWKDSQEVNF